MQTHKENNTKDIDREQQKSFIEGDNVVPQDGYVDDNEEPVEEKSNKINKQLKDKDKREPEVNPPSDPPQRTEKKIPNLRNNS